MNWIVGGWAVASDADALMATEQAMAAIKKMLAVTGGLPNVDRRALAVAKTNLETGLLWVANAANGGGLLDGE